MSLSDMVAVAAESADVECGGGGFALSRRMQMAGHAANLRVARGGLRNSSFSNTAGEVRAPASTHPATACIQCRKQTRGRITA